MALAFCKYSMVGSDVYKGRPPVTYGSMEAYMED
jgi:hypothetical protein